MKKKIMYIFLILLVVFSTPINVFAEDKCVIMPDDFYANSGLIAVPKGYEYKCTYTFDSKSSTYGKKKVEDSLNPNKIVLSFSGDYGDFTVFGYENSDSYSMFTFDSFGEVEEMYIIDNSETPESNELYIHNSRFSPNISFTYNPAYGCPSSFTMTSAEDDTSYFDFTNELSPKKDSIISSTAFLVFKLSDLKGGVLTNGSISYSSTLKYEELESMSTLSVPYAKKIFDYINNSYGKDRYLDEYREFDSFREMACYDLGTVITDPVEQEGIKECEQLLDEDAIKLLKTIFTWIQIIAPILVIVLSGVDFAGALLKDDADALKKAMASFAKRLVIAVILFFVPIIIKFLLDNVNSLTGHNSTTCGIK